MNGLSSYMPGQTDNTQLNNQVKSKTSFFFIDAARNTFETYSMLEKLVTRNEKDNKRVKDTSNICLNLIIPPCRMPNICYITYLFFCCCPCTVGTLCCESSDTCKPCIKVLSGGMTKEKVERQKRPIQKMAYQYFAIYGTGGFTTTGYNSFWHQYKNEEFLLTANNAWNKWNKTEIKEKIETTMESDDPTSLFFNVINSYAFSLQIRSQILKETFVDKSFMIGIVEGYLFDDDPRNLFEDPASAPIIRIRYDRSREYEHAKRTLKSFDLPLFSPHYSSEENYFDNKTSQIVEATDEKLQLNNNEIEIKESESLIQK